MQAPMTNTAARAQMTFAPGEAPERLMRTGMWKVDANSDTITKWFKQLTFDMEDLLAEVQRNRERIEALEKERDACCVKNTV